MQTFHDELKAASDQRQDDRYFQLRKVDTPSALIVDPAHDCICIDEPTLPLDLLRPISRGLERKQERSVNGYELFSCMQGLFGSSVTVCFIFDHFLGQDK